jgi:hypothetical protein
MSVLLVSSIIGTLTIIISTFIVLHTQQQLTNSFDTNLTNRILYTNVENKKGSQENDVIKGLSDRIEMGTSHISSDAYNRSQMDKQFKNNLYNLNAALAKYKSISDDQLSIVQSEIQKIHKAQVPLSIVDIDNKTRMNLGMIDSLKVKNINQDIALKTTTDQHDTVTKTLTKTSNVMNQINNNYLVKSDLRNYTDRPSAARQYQQVNNYVTDTNGLINALDTTFNGRALIDSVKQLIKVNTARCNQADKDIDALAQTLIKTSDLQQIKFPISSYDLPPEMADKFNKMKTSLISSSDRARFGVPQSYVDKNTFKQARNIIMSTSVPAIKFPRKDVLHVDGRAGISQSELTTRFATNNSSSSWNTIFQNGNSTVNISNGDGNGCQIVTRNNNPNISAMNVTNYNNVLLDVKNDGVVNTNRLDVNKLTADTQLCINDTCIYTRDLFKAPLIIIKPPTQKANFASNYNVESILTLNLDDFFTDASSVVVYSLVFNPNGNAVLSGPNNRTLTISGSYRNRQYTVVIRAANNNGGYLDRTLTITEPGAVDCAISDYVWTACSVPCGGGSQTGTSTIVRNKVGPGANCPPLSISRACNTQACPVYNFPVSKLGRYVGSQIGTIGQTISLNISTIVSCPQNTPLVYSLQNASTYPNAYMSGPILYVTITRPVRNYYLDINVTNGNGAGKTITVSPLIVERARNPTINATFSPIILSRSGSFFNGRSVTYRDLNVYFTNYPESGRMRFYIANTSVPASISGTSLTISYHGGYGYYNIVVRAENSVGTAEQVISVSERNI